jgi:large subunit ribosomal protein L25
MPQTATLTALPRATVGSRDARKLRREGRIPINLMAADGKPATSLSIDRHEFMNLRRAHVHLYDLEFDGETESALIRELQWDTFGEGILHVDFKRVQKGVETEAEVELEFFGQPKSGYANHLVTHITVITLPSNIPDSILVKLGGLDEGDHVKAGELVMPEGVKLGVPADLELVVIAGVHHEPEQTPEELEAAEAAAAAALAGETKDSDKKDGEDKDEDK